MLIEANSPTEALVKFRCTREAQHYQAPEREEITSVSPTDPDAMTM
jgi:hypothetical protein